nr:MAG: ORF1 [TTV-like mini virus]
MPWWRRRRRRRWWYRRPWRRTRTAFRPRYYRRRWVRRKFYKKKLKKLKLYQYQPKAIRKTKVKGMIGLFQCTSGRYAFNFDMYELSYVPEFLPGGGGFGIKAFTLNALYAEHVYARNVWTHSNIDLPLVRYVGCKVKLFQSRNVDYCFSYSNSWPMQSDLAMYNTMQSSLHMMLLNSIKIPSKQTQTWKKTYKKIWIPPPTQLTNKWYYQYDLSKTPLLMTRASACSFDDYYIDPHAQSSNINIPYLNANLFQNRQFKKVETSGYWAKKFNNQKIYLYGYKGTQHVVTEMYIRDLIFLGDTKNNVPGKSFEEHFHNSTNFSNNLQTWKTTNNQYWGNPFYTDYLKGDIQTFQSTETYSKILNNFTDWNTKIKAEWSFTEVNFTETLRYNPYNDPGTDNMCYFKSAINDEEGWDPPSKEELINSHLPLWLLLFGFPDYHKKIKTHLHLDDEWILVISTTSTRPIRQYIPILNQSFIEGLSPFETGPNLKDQDRWYPTFQFQMITYNNICLCGPGTPKIPGGTDVEAKMQYCFYFKFGGHPPPMQPIKDPKDQPVFPVPNNQLQTTSLQHPENYPQQLLYSFDQRRHQITDKAIQRLQKDWGLKKTIVSDGTSHFSEPMAWEKDPSQETTTSEEEEAETLFDKLQQQRIKQRNLKRRILETLQALQKLE